MKIYKIIILLALSNVSTAYCQQKKQTIKTIDVKDLKHPESIKSNNLNIKDSSLDKYVGTWIWKDSDKSLTVIFNKKITHYGGNDNVLDVEMLSGSYQYLVSGKLIISVGNRDFNASSGGKKDTVNVFIDIMSRKTSVALLAIYLNSNSIRLELDNNRFEFKNDKDFELPNPIVLVRQ
jgi:hypothetical protein